MNQEALDRIEHKYPTLYEHPSGAVIDFDRKDGTLTLHDEHDRDTLSIPIGPIGMLEMAAKLTLLAVELLEGAK